MKKIELSGHYGYRRIVWSMLPMMAMMLVTSVYSIVDGFFISNFAGSTAFAAMNIIWPAIAILSSTGLMLGAGGSALVSKTLGEGDTEKAQAIFTRLTRFSLLIGCLFAVLTFVWMRPLCQALGASEEMLDPAVTYGRILVAVMPFQILQLEFQSFYMTAEKPHLGTQMSILCGITNILLDALFIIGFGWGLTGAAIATALAMALGGIFPIAFFASRRNTTHLQFVKSDPALRRRISGSLGQSCLNGLSEYVGNIAFNIVGICYNLQLMRYIGEDGVSAYGILLYTGFIFGALFFGYNMGISQVIAYNYGAGNRAELRSLLRKSLVLIGMAGLLLTAASELAAPLLSRIFVGYDEELCRLTEHAARIYMISFFLFGFNVFTSAWFTALNNGIVSAIAAFARTLIFELGAVLLLPRLIGVNGIWWSVDLADALAFVLSVTLILAFRRRYLGYPSEPTRPAE